MGLEGLGILMFVFGIFIAYISFKFDLSKTGFQIAIILAIIFLSLGTYLIFTNLSIYQILKKIFGFVLSVIGYLLVFIYPGSSDYQKDNFTLTGILIGLVFLGIGLYLLFF